MTGAKVYFLLDLSASMFGPLVGALQGAYRTLTVACRRHLPYHQQLALVYRGEPQAITPATPALLTPQTPGGVSNLGAALRVIPADERGYLGFILSDGLPTDDWRRDLQVRQAANMWVAVGLGLSKAAAALGCQHSIFWRNTSDAEIDLLLAHYRAKHHAN